MAFAGLVLIAMLPFLLGNGACDSIYRSLGLTDDDARYGDTGGNETPGDSDPAEATPYLKKDDDTGSGSDDESKTPAGHRPTPATSVATGACSKLYSPTDNWRVIRPGQAVTTD